MSSSTSVLVVSSPTTVKQNPFKRKFHEINDEDEYSKPPPPSWEILSLIGHYMKPETLAAASCVSTMWLQCFSSENLWKSLLIAHYPQRFSIAVKDNVPESQYKHILSAYKQDAKRRRKNQVRDIKISLSDLKFSVDVSTGSISSTVEKEGKDLTFGPNEPFHIEVDVSEFGFTIDTLKDVKITWQVIYRNYKKVFTIKETTKSFVDTNLGWFTDELPDPLCIKGSSTKLVGDVKPSFNGNLLEKVRFGIADSSSDCESLFLDDVLRYLQLFLV